MVDILYTKATRCKEMHCIDRTSNQRGHSNTADTKINNVRKKALDTMSVAFTPTRPEFTDTYWIIPLYSDTPHGKVSFTRQEARLFRAMFKENRLIWAGRQPAHEGVEEISIPQGRVNITPPSTITEIVTVQGVVHV